jgi:hypothetical protein
MGLPPFEGNTAILTVVGQFSKATHFIPLPRLPLAKETAQLMVQHLFRIHRLPVDMSLTGVLNSRPSPETPSQQQGSSLHAQPSPR